VVSVGGVEATDELDEEDWWALAWLAACLAPACRVAPAWWLARFAAAFVWAVVVTALGGVFTAGAAGVVWGTVGIVVGLGKTDRDSLPLCPGCFVE
jgi:hypothetical protein